MTDNNSVERHPPLKPVVFHILLVLAEGDRHGYGVMKAVRTQSEGRIRLTTGSFYRHLKNLLDQRLVDATDFKPPKDDPRRGAYYTLTPQGRAVVAAEARRLAGLVAESVDLDLISPEAVS